MDTGVFDNLDVLYLDSHFISIRLRRDLPLSLNFPLRYLVTGACSFLTSMLLLYSRSFSYNFVLNFLISLVWTPDKSVVISCALIDD